MQHDLLEKTATGRRFARVVLPVPLSKPFTYEVPEELSDGVFVGRRVEVPFGRRVLSGVVTELIDEPDVASTKPIRALYETFLPGKLFEVARWIASYYGCTEGEAMQSVLPPSLKRAKVRPRPTGILRLADREILEGGEASDAFAAAQASLKRAKKQLALLVELTSAGGEAAVQTVVGEWGYARSIVDGFVARGFGVIEKAAATSSPLDRMDETVTQLTDAQQKALTHVQACIESHEFRPVLLYGVTGSGKTEVYLRAARRVLEQGGGCIVLVPEIGLIPQATARYRRMFGDDVAIIHSRLTGPERFEIWEKVERGECRIVVGPRSAVFSPMRKLGLIIVDEEQDDSYKQDEKPRYHARNVALVRGQKENATVVLGSATPSAESSHLALEKKYDSLRLPKRAQGAALPDVHIVDMREEEDKGALFSDELVERLDRNIAGGHQSIVFLNKRGHARYVQCNACGWVANCTNCDISLTYHRVDQTLKCHFCGYARPMAKRCDDCKGARLFFSGVGTQRVELALQSLFPGAAVLRMDADTTSGKEGHRRVLEEFSTGNYPILLGTQMVTKGHHFPGVNLVGVISADEGLNFPDFRSAERTFQALTQVAGRSGRGEHPGDVIVQTFMPEHYVFRFLAEHNYDEFMHEELEVRRRLKYPPFSRLVLASCSATDPDLLHALMARWAAVVRGLPGAGSRFDVLGPAPPLVARVKNRYREQLLVRGALRQPDKAAIRRAWDDVAGRKTGPRGVELRWDVDPESFF